jgi:hypothetical protein
MSISIIGAITMFVKASSEDISIFQQVPNGQSFILGAQMEISLHNRSVLPLWLAAAR